MSKSILFEGIQINIRTHFSYISPVDKTLSGAATPGQSETDSDAIKE